MRKARTAPRTARTVVTEAPVVAEAREIVATHEEAVATMSTTAAEINSFVDQTRKLYAPMAKFGEIQARAFERVAKYNYEVAGDWLNLSIAQLHAATQAKDVPALMQKHAELANGYLEKQTQRSQELLKIATETQAEFTQAVDQASSELTARVRNAA